MSKIGVMDNESLGAGGQTFVRPANSDTEIELLARETQVPLEIVAKIYTSERKKLERTARLKPMSPC